MPVPGVRPVVRRVPPWRSATPGRWSSPLSGGRRPGTVLCPPGRSARRSPGCRRSSRRAGGAACACRRPPPRRFGWRGPVDGRWRSPVVPCMSYRTGSGCVFAWRRAAPRVMPLEIDRGWGKPARLSSPLAIGGHIRGRWRGTEHATAPVGAPAPQQFTTRLYDRQNQAPRERSMASLPGGGLHSRGAKRPDRPDHAGMAAAWRGTWWAPLGQPRRHSLTSNSRSSASWSRLVTAITSSPG